VQLHIIARDFVAPRNDEREKHGKPHMHAPSITAFYLALLALLYALLTLHVIRLRQGNRAAFGDGDSITLRRAIRAHSNFIEYVPIVTPMVGFMEMSGASAVRIHLLMGALVVSRLLHPLGMYAAPNTQAFRIGRVGGMTLTIGLLIACALMILSRLVLGGSN
jgi:uncharacterized protein